MHLLLKRQLRRLGLGEDQPPSDPDSWRALLSKIDETYADGDRERYMIERSMSISSREMHELYQKLKDSSETQIAAERDRLKHSLMILHATLESIDEALIIVANDGRLSTVNRKFIELWNIPPDLAENQDGSELLGHVRSLLKESDVFAQRDAWMERHPLETAREEVVLEDGRVFEQYCAPIITGEGVYFGRLRLFRDVTDKRHGEREIRRVNHFLDSIVEHLPEMVFVKDAKDLSFVQLNRAGEELLGWSRTDMIGKSDLDFFPREQAQYFIATDRVVLSGRKVVDVREEEVSTRQGNRWLQTKKIPIYEDGTPKYLLGIARDITETKRVELELRQAKESAEQANSAKTDFLSNMSHEFRTPLNSVLGFAGALLSGTGSCNLEEHQRKLLRYIVGSGEHMLELVNDLLDLRRIEARKTFIQIGKFHLRDIVDDTVSMILPIFTERGHDVKIELSQDLPEVCCDATAVAQILVNLLGNAAKFTPDRGRLGLNATADGSLVRITVWDQGIGIAPEDQAKLFNYFVQVGAKHRHHMKGSGIGLALTKALVEEMGGTLAVESELGKGTRFSFALAAAPPGDEDKSGGERGQDTRR